MVTILFRRNLVSFKHRCIKISSVHHFSQIKILGIETSCDDTGCALVNSAGEILGESLYSQNAIHIRNGGINPIFARELHRENIEPAVSEVLAKVDDISKDINAISVTVKPGLLISLDIGVKYARYLARKNSIPIIPIHHMEAHALVARMYYDIPFPFLVLLISGGHCLLAIAKDINDFLLLGQSMDNAPGEIFDKAARRMKLKNLKMFSTLAGGRAIELAASKSQNPDMFKFPLPLNKIRDCNFSFSGLRDSFQRKLYEKESEHGVIADGLIPEVNDLCASFQLAIAEHIANKTERAIKFCTESNILDGKCNVVVSGGVACNNFIFKSIQYVASKYNFNVYRPPPQVCTDNGIMIAWNGVEKFQRGLDIQTWIENSEINDEAPLGKDISVEIRKADIPVRVTRLHPLYSDNFESSNINKIKCTKD